MNLVIDGGNTATKAYIFDESGNIVQHDVFRGGNTAGQIEAFAVGFPVKAAIYSHVGRDRGKILKALKSVYPFIVSLNADMPLPFTHDYTTPETLGLDRLALAAGLLQYPPAAMAIDCGSCITYEIVEAGVYKGGAISPGIHMRLKSMHHFTASLPLIEDIENTDFPAKTTKSCMMAGTINAVVHEINGFINSFMAQQPKGKVILTGGDANYLVSALKKRTFANPFITAQGLNKILNDQS